jgi:hypothetical protein
MKTLIIVGIAAVTITLIALGMLDIGSSVISRVENNTEQALNLISR